MQVQECHIDVKEDQLTKLMVAEGFVHGAEVIMRAETFKRCLLHVSSPPSRTPASAPHLSQICSFHVILLSPGSLSQHALHVFREGGEPGVVGISLWSARAVRSRGDA